MSTDILVVGGGMGGVAATLAALRRGQQVVLTEATDWVGGQLTSQGVPPDEHPWIEELGCTASYRRLRDGIRDYYRRHYPLTEPARAMHALNPGDGRVGPLCHEPVVAWKVLDAMLAPFVASGDLTVLLEHRPIAVDQERDRIRAVRLEGVDGTVVDVDARYVLDATELGDILTLGGVEHVTGAELRLTTGEPHAPLVAQPMNMQAFSLCFAVEHCAGEDHTVERPSSYEYWRDIRPTGWPDRLLSFRGPNPQTLEPRTYSLDPDAVTPEPSANGYDLWSYRRILSRRVLQPGAISSDITLVNWPMNDYFIGPLIGVSDEEKQAHLAGARDLSLSLLYWLQTEAPRPDGGAGWPALRLRGEALGTADGLAKAAYIRESRRIEALTRVVEQDVSFAERGSRGATVYDDSVGIGAYRIDLHPSTGGDNYIDVASVPFQIPLGALIPVRVENLLAAGKNAGTTHITNGCYRLHPVEWNIGEAAGALAAHCLSGSTNPIAVRSSPARTSRFQAELVADGFELAWPDRIRLGPLESTGAP